jgi:hypothetical protein
LWVAIPADYACTNCARVGTLVGVLTPSYFASDIAGSIVQLRGGDLVTFDRCPQNGRRTFTQLLSGTLEVINGQDHCLYCADEPPLCLRQVHCAPVFTAPLHDLEWSAPFGDSQLDARNLEALSMLLHSRFGERLWVRVRDISDFSGKIVFPLQHSRISCVDDETSLGGAPRVVIFSEGGRFRGFLR